MAAGRFVMHALGLGRRHVRGLDGGDLPQTGRAYRLKLAFDDFWIQPAELAAAYLERWCRWAVRSRLVPLVEFAAMVRAHRDGILRWATSRISNAVLEAIASLVRAAKGRARGYRTTENLMVIAYLVAGKLDFGCAARMK